MTDIKAEIKRLTAELDAASEAACRASCQRHNARGENQLSEEWITAEIETHHRAIAKWRQKYVALDIGKSGVFMVDIETGLVYGIKGYGRIHPDVIHGRVDLITGAQLYPRQGARAHTPPIEAATEALAAQECEYPGSAGCNLLPQGVVRSVCLPCKARAALKADRERVKS